MYVLSQSRVNQCKFLLALGLQSLPKSRKIIHIVHKLGHCISYNLMNDTETPQANSSLSSSKKGDILPVQPSKNDAVLGRQF